MLLLWKVILMDKLSRMIGTTYSPEQGDLYYLLDHKQIIGKYLTLEAAEEARREHDFTKAKWCSIGLDNRLDAGAIWEAGIDQDMYTGQYYVKCVCPDDIIVSDLCRSRQEAKDIKKWLSKKNFHVHYLNSFKKDKNANRKFAGIIPLKDGFLIQDTTKKRHGIYKDIQEALMKRDSLRAEGVWI